MLQLALLLCCFTCSLSGAIIELGMLSLEEKVGQLLMVHFRGEDVNDEATTLVQTAHVGGIIYYDWANGLTSHAQVRQLSSHLQKLTEANTHSIPLFIAVDQEGGRVSRLKGDFPSFPGNSDIAKEGNPLAAEAIATTIGRTLKDVGITINFAPVVDVNTNPKNPVIGSRSFGSDPQTVVSFAQKALQGYKAAQVIATLKHFPGHGNVTVDSHYALPVVQGSLQELEKVELLPFSTLCPEAEMIMTAHILVPALDPDHCATLSKKTLSYLRDTLGYKGVIIADSLVMKGVLSQCQTVEEAAIQALDAGCDILLLGGMQLNRDEGNLDLSVQDVLRIHRAIVNAVQSGRISHARLDQAVEKILTLKSHYFAPFAFFTLSAQDTQTIGDRIWKSECAGDIKRLIHWNEGEDFASLGIGHFIWYPAGAKHSFEETFPKLLEFLGKDPIPCPWSTREEFYRQFDSPESQELRQLLFTTRDKQAQFIINRFLHSVPHLLKQCSDQDHVLAQITTLMRDTRGLYALIDYLHFKGTGLAPTERYHNQGWGLLQVLQTMPAHSPQALEDFVKAAKTALRKRVEHSPPDKNEQRWLPGWLNRVEGYLM